MVQVEQGEAGGWQGGRARHRHDFAGHVGRVVARQHDHDVGHLPRLGSAAEGLARLEFFEQAVGGDLGQERVHGEARRHRVDADVVRGGLHGGAACERHDPGLGGRVVRLQFLRPPAEHGRVVHHGAAPALIHVGKHGAKTAERAGERDVEHLRPRIVGHLDDRCVAAEPRVVHPDVDVAELLDARGDERSNVVLAGHVADLGAGSPARLGLDPVGGLTETPLVHVGDQHVGALFDAATGEGEPDAGAGRGRDHHVLLVQQSVRGWVGRWGRHVCAPGSCQSGEAGWGSWWRGRAPAQRGSRGRPSARSPITLRWIWSDPP